MICPRCNGEKKLTAVFPVKVRGQEIPCRTCNGTGEIDTARLGRIAAGSILRQARIDAGYGLRAFAEKLGVLPSTWAKIEQGDGFVDIYAE